MGSLLAREKRRYREKIRFSRAYEELKNDNTKCISKSWVRVRRRSYLDGLNRLGTTVVVATHDLHLLSRVGTAQMMRLDHGRLSDPTGALKYPPLGEDV